MNCTFFFNKNSLICYINEYISIDDIKKIKYNVKNKEIIFNKNMIVFVDFPVDSFDEFVICFSKTPEIFYFLKHNGQLVINPKNSIKNF